MPRKKVTSEPALQSWSDVDKTLKLIGEFERHLEEIKIEMQRQQAKATEAADLLAQPYQQKIKKLAMDVRDYVTAHRDEMDGKTKQLNFGNTGFRLNTKLMTPNAPDIIANLKRYKMGDCINVKESIFKEVLRKYPSDIILKTGAYLKSEDEFWYETAKEDLQSTE